MTTQDNFSGLNIGDSVYIGSPCLPRSGKFEIVGFLQNYVNLKDSKGNVFSSPVGCINKNEKVSTDFRAKNETCQQRLSKKIGINMSEWKQGRYVSKEQAIAVAYSQINQEYPHCKQHLKKSTKKSPKKTKKSSKKSPKKSPKKTKKSNKMK